MIAVMTLSSPSIRGQARKRQSPVWAIRLVFQQGGESHVLTQHPETAVSALPAALVAHEQIHPAGRLHAPDRSLHHRDAGRQAIAVSSARTSGVNWTATATVPWLKVYRRHRARNHRRVADQRVLSNVSGNGLSAVVPFL